MGAGVDKTEVKGKRDKTIAMQLLYITIKSEK